MTRAEMIDVLLDVTLPNGWVITGCPITKTRLAFRIEGGGTCAETGKPYLWQGRAWPLTAVMTKGEIVQTVFMATMAAVEHETRAAFRYKGAAVFGPHHDIDALVALTSKGATHD